MMIKALRAERPSYLIVDANVCYSKTWHRDRSSVRVHHHISGVESSGIGRQVFVPGLTDFPDNRPSLSALETILTILLMKDNERFSDDFANRSSHLYSSAVGFSSFDHSTCALSSSTLLVRYQ